MNRIKLCDRELPKYSRAEEIVNMITHIVGGSLAVLGFCICLVKAIHSNNMLFIFSTILYGSTMVLLYSMSSIYHGLKPGTAKKVMQILDHCTIYFLITGTYTPIVLCAIRPVYPAIGWGLFLAEWSLAAVAATLTAIDLKKYRILSMVCYIGMGWGIIFFLPQTKEVLSPAGFSLLFAGGVAYTIGAVLFGLGKKIKWMHSIFHIFVVLGSVLQLITIIFFVL